MSSTVPRDRVLADLRTFAADLGETPTWTLMNDDGPHSSTPYEREFGGWTAALRAAGLDPNHENDIDDERLVAELRPWLDQTDRPGLDIWQAVQRLVRGRGRPNHGYPVGNTREASG